MSGERNSFLRIPPTTTPVSIAQDEINVYVPVGTASLADDKVVLRIHWLDNSNNPTEIWNFTKTTLEIAGATTFEVVGNATDNSTAVATRVKNSTALTQTGGRIFEAENNDITRVYVDHLGGIALGCGEYGGHLKHYTWEEEVDINAAWTSVTTNEFPAGSYGFATCMTTTTIPTATGYCLGTDSGDSDGQYWGSGISTAYSGHNQTLVFQNGFGKYMSSAIAVRITPDAVPATATGTVRVQGHYWLAQPPTS